MKKKRQERILSLIKEREIGTQEEIVNILNEEGYKVTQATVSRDIRELALTKIPGNKVKQRYYHEVKTSYVGNLNIGKQYSGVIQEGIISMDNAGNLLVIKTVSGMAMAVAAALDSMQIEEIVGSIAGDDTILCAIKSEEQVTGVIKYIQEKIDLMTSKA